MTSGDGARKASPRPRNSPDRVLALSRAIAAVPLARIEGTLCRAVRARHLEREIPEPLHFAASARVGGRFTPLGGPAGLYLAADQPTALAEIRDLLLDPRGRPLPLAPRDPVTLVYVRLRLDGVLDLTRGDVRSRLRASRDALRAEWREAMEAHAAECGAMPLPQQVGLAAHRTGRIRGILYESARAAGRPCLVVFPDRLSAADHVEAQDAGGRYRQVLPAGGDAGP